MKQKLALICTVIHEPPILLLDEPTTGVDPVSRRDFWKILHRLLAEGVTLLISTPYMDEAERCNRIGLIHEGKLLQVDTPAELKRQMTGEVIEIKCAQPYMANAYLKSHDAVESVQAFSDKLRVRNGYSHLNRFTNSATSDDDYFLSYHAMDTSLRLHFSHRKHAQIDTIHNLSDTAAVFSRNYQGNSIKRLGLVHTLATDVSNDTARWNNSGS